MVSHPQTLPPPAPLYESRQRPHGLLLCCVCHEHNTTFRYEVVYKTAAASLSSLHHHPSIVALQQQQQLQICQPSHSVRITELTDDGEELENLDSATTVKDTSLVISSPNCHTISPVGTVSIFSDDQSHEYYNFPPRHPRHGHLKWPVWTPNPSPTPNGGISPPPICIATYPDYPIHIPTVTLKRISSAQKGAITTDLRQYLNTRFPKGGIDHELQNTIRDNLYLRTVPVTTRPPRPEERNGIDYTFLSKEEFIALEKSGELLESGIYDGNHYGTPKPSKESSTSSRSSEGVTFPGAHPSSEGKRRRNRSNVEAMTAKHFQQEDKDDLAHTNGNSPETPSGSTSTSKSGGSGPHGADSGHPDSPDDVTDERGDPLGPLPPNWEKAYTEKGEVYFIDHSSGTSHWLDPRLSRVQKTRPEDCSDDELPFGWERIDDPHYGTYFIDHVNRRTQYENPVLVAKAANQSADAIMGPSDHHREGPPMVCPPNGPGTFPRVKKNQSSPFFTRDPNLLRGERIRCQLVKSTKGLGFTIVGGDDNVEEFLQIKSVVPNGPAWLDGRLKTGDVLVYVNETCVLGFTHHDMVTMFQSISSGESVGLEVCRGYPLPFDPDDPNTEIVTTVAVTSPDQNEWANELERQRITMGVVNQSSDVQSMPDLTAERHHHIHQGGVIRPGSADLLGDRFVDPAALKHNISGGGDQNDVLTIPVTKGGMGFGFTIADSAFGQKVKKILDRPRCKNLQEGDILVEINNVSVRGMSHSEVVQVLKDCSRGQEANITIQRGLLPQTPTSATTSPTKSKYKKTSKDETAVLKSKSGFLFRSKTPTAELYSTQEKEKVPNRPKTPLVDTRYFLGGSKSEYPSTTPSAAPTPAPAAPFQRNDITRASLGGGNYFPAQQQHHPASNYYNALPDQMSALTMGGYQYQDNRNAVMTADYQRSRSPGRDLDGGQGYLALQQQQQQQQQNAQYDNYYAQQQQPMYGYGDYGGGQNYGMMPSPGNYGGYQVNGYGEETGYGYTQGYSPSQYQRSSSGSLPRGSSLAGARKESTSFEHSEPLPGNLTRWPRPERRVPGGGPPTEYIEMTVTLHRQDTGFGFRIVGGTEEGSQVSIGHIVPGGAADLDGRLFSGDEIVAVDNIPVINTSHHQVVGLMGQSAQNGRVTLAIRRRVYQPDGYSRSTAETYPYDVTVTRRENEGFGFVIISSVSRAGSTIGRIITGSPAERCGRLHIGDRILAVNHVDINNMHHGEIVNLIKDSGYSVVLTVGPPIDDTSSTASTSQRSTSVSSMVTAQALPTVLPPSDSAGTGSTISITSGHAQADKNFRSASVGYQDQGPMYPHRHPPNGRPPFNAHTDHLMEDLSYRHFDRLEPKHQDNQEDQELNMLEMDDQYYAVELGRGARGFGFSIRGGREFQSMPLFVLRIAVDGPAAADGRLRVGDQIIEINGINTKNMTHAEAIELIKSGGNVVRLLVRRGKMPPTALMDQVGMSPLSPTPMPTSSSSVAMMGRPMSAMSQPTTAMAGGSGYMPSHLPPGALPLPGLTSSNSAYPSQTSYTPNGYLNGPVSQSSPRMINNNSAADGYYYNQY